MVLMFFIVSVTNNYALSFNIALPLHMIFRAGSLLANMILGIMLFYIRSFFFNLKHLFNHFRHFNIKKALHYHEIFVSYYD